jgi:hypothetical protein
MTPEAFSITAIVVVSILFIAFMIWVSIFVPLKMARKRNRNAFGWVMVSILVNPLVSIIALLAMGDAEDKANLSETFA